MQNFGQKISDFGQKMLAGTQPWTRWDPAWTRWDPALDPLGPSPGPKTGATGGPPKWGHVPPGAKEAWGEEHNPPRPPALPLRVDLTPRFGPDCDEPKRGVSDLSL